ncbi:MAG: 2-succinyl-5-enolpyruvyl-6-hydroxy-3-cyclohexene-1-carboxylic-acid synthase [Bowdeniella nasicola]|nr:2-succinyl-5-enolpyruvyl-6-hydroxy-3-cyclohexene-1-carboxylic-acid synthase [Bowdeniella nasicola]
MSEAMRIARSVIADLVAAGLRDVVLCPGSRSAPLAYAVAEAEQRGEVRVLVRLDERAAAFSALGMALASRRPAAIVTTSGTAVANLYPALAEADAACVPVLALTGDRPPELWGTGANQTTHQSGMFTNVVRYGADIGETGELSDVPDLRDATQAAWAHASGVSGPAPGPAHLNICLAPPLTDPLDVHGSAGVGELDGARKSDGVHGSAGVGEFDGARAAASDENADAIVARLAKLERAVVVAGDKADGVPGIRAALTRLDLPVLAEPSSNLRDLPTALTNPTAALGALEDRIGSVVVVGHPTLTRPVTRLVSRTDVEQIVLATNERHLKLAANREVVRLAAEPGQNGGVGAGVSGPTGPPAATAARLAGDDEKRHAWLDAWRRADQRHEPNVFDAAALAVWEESVGAELVVGASSTIRALDRVAPGGAPGPRVWANRGLAGIDGTIATAWGIARSLRRPVRAVLGDLTFLHDASALLRGRLEEGVDLQIVILDDAGGSIFGMLEHGQIAALGEAEGRRFDRYFRTAQDADYASLAATYGARYHEVDLRGAAAHAAGEAGPGAGGHQAMQGEREAAAEQGTPAAGATGAVPDSDLLADLRAVLAAFPGGLEVVRVRL